jgi:TolB-like protein
MSVDVPGRTNPPSCEPPLAGISAAEVASALDLILSSDAFAKVERPGRFLRHVVEASLRGQQNLLKESLLGIEIFGREPSWNPRIDPIVRQEAARLRKRLAKYYETASPEVRIHLPVGTYVPVFHRVTGDTAEPKIAGPDGSLEDVPLEDAPGVARKPKRYLWIAFAAVLLFAVGALAAWRFFKKRSTGGPPSIVVLPFTNLSTDSANEYLASAVTGEITDELVRLNSLRVTARTSAHAFKSGSADVRDVGRQLNVSYVLEGSVERSRDQVRISAHLERTSDGFRVWYQTYDRPAKDLSSLQAELTAAVARSLQVYSGQPVGPRHIPTAEVHELYMRAFFEIDQATPESIAEGEQDLRRVVQIDPDYAYAWELLGVARQNVSIARGLSPTPEERTEAKDFYRKSLEVDPDLSTAHANLAAIAMINWDWPAAEDELRLALHTENAGAERNYGMLSAFRGRFREADQHIGVASSLDPLDSGTSLDLIQIRYMEGRISDAVAVSTLAAERYPGQIMPQLLLNLSYIQGGQTDRALANLGRLKARYPAARLFEVMALGRSGRREEGLRRIQQLETEYEGDSQVYRFWFALAWASLGDHAHTLKSLERSADLRESGVLTTAVIPNFAEMRNDPGFRALVKRIGLM